MNSALQPQLLKHLMTIQEDLRSAILLRCVGGQFKSYLNLTIGDNVQHSTLREHVLQWDVAVQTIKDLCQWKLIESKMPKIKVRRARMAIGQAQVKMPRAKERKGEGDQKGKRRVITRVKAQTDKAKVWQHVTLPGSQDILLKTVGETTFDR